MCTAAVYQTKNTYFGRNLDLEFSYGESIAILPHNSPLNFRHTSPLTHHHAIIGVAYITPDSTGQDYPLLYDAINDQGLGMAGLNFVGNAILRDPVNDPSHPVDNITQFEFLPWILGQCSTVAEARKLLAHINLCNTPFNTNLPPSELHWIIADVKDCIVVEAIADGLHVYDNPVKVLTNNPPFPEQLFALNNYRHLSPTVLDNTFLPSVDLNIYSRGMGSLGLPGDLTSQSRFIRASFTRAHSISPDDPESSISQFFHILHSVDQTRGLCELGDNKYEITVYSSGYNLNAGVCYYTAYDNHQITAVDMHRVDLEGSALVKFPMLTTEQINYQN